MLRVVWVGRTRPGPAAEWVEEYRSRIARFHPIEIVEARDAQGHGKGRAARESRELRARLGIGRRGRDSAAPGGRKGRTSAPASASSPRGLVVALDETGTAMTSRELARFLERSLAERGEVTFLLGGADGLSSDLVGESAATLSLSRLTFTHEMARVVLLEQIYRALSILKGTPYHR
jgi:23S rRNA (pseudouridine1915-N3)-methyltransferase